MKVIAGIVVLLVVLLVVLAFARMLSRFFRGDVELESGGSFGRQLLDKDDEQRR